MGKDKNKKASDSSENLQEEELINNEQVNEDTTKSDETQEEEKKEEPIIELVKEPTFEEKYNNLNDKYLRLSAEFDNYRKRTLKERMDLIKSAGEDILVNFLPVLDNIQRAQQSVNDSKDIKAVSEGVNLILKTMSDFLSQKGIKEIEAVGKEFDTDLHEALTKIPAPSKKLKGKVVDVIEKGYKLNDKVIRFAKVVIGE